MKTKLNIFFEIQWGEKSLVALYLSIMSGIVLSLQYEPTTPLYSIGSIDLLIPFGAFWRSLHFYSSQLFFLLLLLHFFVILFDKTEHISIHKWIWLILSLPVALLLLFTGYILRADTTGESAGIIAENIVLSIPLLGEWLNGLLFSIADEGMKRVYANHLISLGVLWLVLCWDHLRKYRVNWLHHGDVVLGLFIFCLILNAPIEPEKMGVFHVSGPWFFLGLQELLRYVQPFWAGILFPFSLLISLCFASAKTIWRKKAIVYAISWLVVYSGLSVAGYLR